MTDLFKRFKEDLQLKGLSSKTIKMYTKAVKQLTKHYQKSPEEISDDELRQYFLYNKNVRKWYRVASTISLCGIKYFYTLTLKREWTNLTFVRPEKEKKRPGILSQKEVKSVLDKVKLTTDSMFIDAELLIKAQKAGCRITELGVEYLGKPSGKSSVTFREVIKIGVDLLKYRFRGVK